MSILQRSCVGCNQKKNKSDLLRIVRDKEENISIDRTYKMQGRGAYICKNIECLDIAIKKRKLEKSFSCKVKPNVYESIKKVIYDE